MFDAYQENQIGFHESVLLAETTFGEGDISFGIQVRVRDTWRFSGWDQGVVFLAPFATGVTYLSGVPKDCTSLKRLLRNVYDKL